MHLEISPRQTGKTFRLVQAALKAIKKRKRIVIVGNSRAHIKFIREEICRYRYFPMYPKDIMVTFCLYKSFPSVDRSCKKFDAYFFDDFDQAPRGHFTRELIFKNGYYYTTPRFIRKLSYVKHYRKFSKKIGYYDTLLELVRIKKGNFHSYHRKGVMLDIDTLTSYATYLGCFRTQLENSFEIPRRERNKEVDFARRGY